MSKLYYRYGTMNSAKSMNLLAVAHNYESQDKKVLLLKPCLDERSNASYIESRTGLKHECLDIKQEDNIYNLIKIQKSIGLSCILTDESQFFTKEQIIQLRKAVNDFKIPIICYGLKTTYTNDLFEGSKELLIQADKIEEIKTICTFCNSKAIMNLRLCNGKPIYNGDLIIMGDVEECEDYYIPVCSKCYNNGGELNHEN